MYQLNNSSVDGVCVYKCHSRAGNNTPVLIGKLAMSGFVVVINYNSHIIIIAVIVAGS